MDKLLGKGKKGQTHWVLELHSVMIFFTINLGFSKSMLKELHNTKHLLCNCNDELNPLNCGRISHKSKHEIVPGSAWVRHLTFGSTCLWPDTAGGFRSVWEREKPRRETTANLIAEPRGCSDLFWHLWTAKWSGAVSRATCEFSH